MFKTKSSGNRHIFKQFVITLFNDMRLFFFIWWLVRHWQDKHIINSEGRLQKLLYFDPQHVLLMLIYMR